MANPNYLENLAAEVLDVDVEASEDRVEDAYNDLVSEHHPDVSDEPDAEEKFKAITTARDILIGEFNFTDSDSRMSAEKVMERLFDDQELGEISERSDSKGTYESTAEKRTNPAGFNVNDFTGMGGEERSQMIKTLSLGVETNIVFQSVSNLYKTGYIMDDFFEDINDYIGSEDPRSVTYGTYYEATKESLRGDVTKSVFIDSIKSYEERLEQEYGQGTNIKEIARIISYFMVTGGIDLGFSGRFMGNNLFGRDSGFSRGPGGVSGFGRQEGFSRERGGFSNYVSKDDE